MTGRSGRRFGLALAAVVALAVAIRLVFGSMIAPDLDSASDVHWYRNMASHLAAGDGMVVDEMGLDGQLVPNGRPPEATAKHPPLHPTVLAVSDFVGLDSWTEQRVVLALIGGLGVALLGLAGRDLLSPRVGLAAAGIAAVHPLWFQSPGLLTAEATYMPLTAGIIWVFARASRRWTVPGAVVLGALAGAAALTRAEALVLAPLLGVAVVAVGDRAQRRRRFVLALVLVMCAGAVVAPWVMRNRSRVEASQVSTNGGVTLLGANCETTYRGSQIGTFNFDCALGGGAALYFEGRDPANASEGQLDRWFREMAVEYARDNLDRLPHVTLARLVRTAGLAPIDSQIDFDVAEGRHETSQRAGLVFHLVLLPFAAVGLVVLGRRRADAALAICLVLFALTAITAVTVYGSTRMRAAAEPAIALCAATGLMAVVGTRARPDVGRVADPTD